MIAAINGWYDRRMFGPKLIANDFSNWGYWTQSTRNHKEACENLMERLLTFIPRKEGKILDVACGKGATTRHLLKYYRYQDVTGINISEKQFREMPTQCVRMQLPEDECDGIGIQG